MNAELKAKWVAALRSGEFKQANGLMLDPKGAMCCLGVLGRICGMPDDTLRLLGGWIGAQSELKPITDAIPDQNTRYTLATMNDGADQFNDRPRSFSEIADYIEAHL